MTHSGINENTLQPQRQKALINRGRLVTWCPASSESFVCEQADTVAPGIAQFFNEQPCSVNIRGYTPPYSTPSRELDVADFLIGFLCLEFSACQPKTKLSSEVLSFSLGVEFGHQTRAQKLYREGIDLNAAFNDPENPQAGNLMAVNFDEAWRFTCALLQRLNVADVTIEYGV